MFSFIFFMCTFIVIYFSIFFSILSWEYKKPKADRFFTETTIGFILLVFIGFMPILFYVNFLSYFSYYSPICKNDMVKNSISKLEAYSCVEFWFNRYQTFISVIFPILVALLVFIFLNLKDIRFRSNDKGFDIIDQYEERHAKNKIEE